MITNYKISYDYLYQKLLSTFPNIPIFAKNSGYVDISNILYLSGTSAPITSAEDLNESYYNVNLSNYYYDTASCLFKALSAPSCTNVWIQHLSIPYLPTSSNSTCIIKGTMPTFKTLIKESINYTLNSSEIFYLHRSDESLKISSAVSGGQPSGTIINEFPASYFPDNIVPYNFLFELQGGGGGGGASNMNTSSDGSGGGAGAYICGVLSFIFPAMYFKITVGGGGSGGDFNSSNDDGVLYAGNYGGSSEILTSVHVRKSDGSNVGYTLMEYTTVGGGEGGYCMYYNPYGVNAAGGSISRYLGNTNAGYLDYTHQLPISNYTSIHLITSNSGRQGGGVNGGTGGSSPSITCYAVNDTTLRNYSQFNIGRGGFSGGSGGGGSYESGGGGASYLGKGGNYSGAIGDVRGEDGDIGAGGGGTWYSPEEYGGDGGPGLFRLYY